MNLIFVVKILVMLLFLLFPEFETNSDVRESS